MRHYREHSILAGSRNHVPYYHGSTAPELLGGDLVPRALFHERIRMAHMRPSRLGAYLILRAVWFALPDVIANRRAVRWLWRQVVVTA